MRNETAVLIFANSAEKEIERKSFLSKEAFSKLNLQTLKIVKKSGFQHFHFSEKNQIGSSFGERFTNAVVTLFKKGFTKIIAIGNDAPHLKTKHLLTAANQLQEKDLVIGPSKDGGFYLIGICKQLFHKESFLKLPWQTNGLLHYIVQRASIRKLNISFLEVLNDIDTKEDIASIVNSLKSISKALLKLLVLAVSINKNFQRTQLLLVLEKSFSKHFNKGSPFLIYS